MTPRRKQMALYEVIRERQGYARPGSANGASPAPQTDKAERRAEPSPDAPPRIAIGPGQAIRVPIGYVFFMVALVLAVGVLGYVLGYAQHQREAARQRADELRRIRDPLAGGAPVEYVSLDPVPVEPGAGPAPTQDAAKPKPRAPEAQAPDAGAPLRRGAAGAVVVVKRDSPDPRRPGMNYVRLAQFAAVGSRDTPAKRAEALRAAEYVASHGVEIGLFERGRRFELIALRPFDRTGEAWQAFQRDLKLIGKRYKDEEDGPVDFSDLWGERYDP